MSLIFLTAALAACALFPGYASADATNNTAGNLEEAQASYPPCAVCLPHRPRNLLPFLGYHDDWNSDSEMMSSSNVSQKSSQSRLVRRLMSSVSVPMNLLPTTSRSASPKAVSLKTSSVSLYHFCLKQLETNTPKQLRMSPSLCAEPPSGTILICRA